MQLGLNVSIEINSGNDSTSERFMMFSKLMKVSLDKKREGATNTFPRTKCLATR